MQLLEEDGRFAVAGRARDGLTAVDLCTKLRPQAVVMDVELPGVDGVAATRALRTVAPSLPIVAVSGHDYEERALEMREAGADDYVRKARVPEDLPQVLAELLERRSS